MTEMPPYLDSNDEEKDGEAVDSDTSADVNDWELPLSFDELRHREPIKGEERVELSWRLKEKYKTHCVALVLCLNLGVDPPDLVKTQPCARQECWIDPNSMSSIKALESIGHALQTQYERWQPRARYKQSLDPTSDDVKKLCCSLRRNAKDERVLFHYNGHGVPRPTSQGEIWVFNRAFTQYIPLSMYDLQTWMGAPSLYVYDCSHAGLIVENFKLFAEQHERDYEKQVSSALAGGGAAPAPVSYRHCLQLGACAAGQALPMNPELPADLFTACLTTPVKMAVRWFVMRARTRVAPDRLIDLVDKIPGQVTDRRTMLGELNWIFTAITDSIAWNSLPPELFQQLFRADLLTASLCRNYLLADRIMRSYNCTPVSSPALPSLASHPLWAAWDQTLDLALAQLPLMLAQQRPYQHSPFFRDQLTAFQVWLDRGSAGRAPPDQLPMVLQVLLSTVHRVRALRLLSRFLALGAWAVRQLLRVGIFPYMLKLLQASAPDLRSDMVYIWHKIIALDPSCQEDLVNAKGHKYFLAVLQDPTVDSEHRTMAAFVLAGVVDNYPAGQEAALQGSMISVCLEQLQAEAAPALLQWTCVALGRLWRQHHDARWAAARDLAHEKLAPLLQHRAPEVRAACAFALGTFMAAGAGRARTDHANALDQQVALQLAQRAPLDASPLVRQQILAALQWLVLSFEQHFIAASAQERARRSDRAEGGGGRGAVEAGQEALPGAARARVRKAPSATNIAHLALPTIGPASVHMKVWWTLSALAQDPHAATAAMARDIITYVAGQLDSVGRDFELVRSSGSAGSLSLPPSPGTHKHVHAHAHASTLPPGHRRGKSQQAAIAEHSPQRERDCSTCSSCSTGEMTKKAIVSTEFVEWSASVFVRGTEPGGALERADRAVDRLSRAHLERVWRYERNAQLRRAARALRSSRASRLESQAFHSRCALPPAALLFHPYEQHIAVASKDNFGVWEWGTGARLLAGAWKRASGRITALEYLNAHDRALLAVASHHGHVALYRHDQTPVTAWRALTPASPEPAPPAAAAAAAGPLPQPYGAPPPPVLLAWCGVRQSLAVAGNAPIVRLWDASSELPQLDVPTETPSAVTSLCRSGSADSLLVCGFADGSCCVWDERAPAASGTSGSVRRALHHDAPLLLAALRHRTLLTACTSGCVRVYDVRAHPLRPLHALHAPGPLAAAAVHPLCDLLACGSVNQLISLWDLGELQQQQGEPQQQGGALQTIKFHEGFMGARIGPTACLAFHPLRCALAVGAKDSTVSVYVTEPRR